MKKTHLIIAGLLVVVLLSCSNSHKTSGSSLVTITVGSNQSASVSIQQATLYAKLRNFLADHLQVSSAMASIPTNVASIQIMAQASDMDTITKTLDTAGLSSVSITIEVPNGVSRHFVVIGFEGPGNTGNMAYWGDMSVDLNGSDVFLPVPMINLGSVTNILYVSTGGNDATGDGSEQNPFRTITNALAASNNNEAIFVGPGTYDDVTGGEIFPLQLNPGTALVGRGQNQTTVINGSSGINGAPGAYIDSLRIFVCDSTGIDDLGSITHINNVLLDSSLSCGGGAGDGIVLAADSTVSNTTIKDPFTSGITINSGNPVIKNNTITVTAGALVSPFNGIFVAAGNPTITNSTINGFFADGAGWAISLGTGTATVSQCSMSGNGNGISISGGSPTISGNTISNSSSYGIYVSLSGAGAPPTATISGNTIGHNGYGIYGDAVGTSLIHNNKIFCSSAVDFYLVDSAANNFDISGNAWDHDTTTLVSGPTITNNFNGCPSGEDICYAYLLTTAPTYTPFNTAVPGGCQ